LELQIIKRTGELVPFDKEKVETAIYKAWHEVYPNETGKPDYAQEIANMVEAVAKELDEPMGVEDIQELVEDYLTDYDLKVGKAYIKYRYKHGVMRANSTEFIRAISEKLRASNVQNQNANIDEHSFGGRVGEASDEMMKQYALDYCVSPMAKHNHLNNEIYIHDLSAYAVGMHNCLSVPFDDLLANGFNTRQTDVRPANSINTAFQLVAVIFQLQSLMQFGGVSATHLDWTMVPYVRKSFNKHFITGIQYILGQTAKGWDIYKTYSIEAQEYKQYSSKVYQYAMDMTEKELQQAVEGMYHNLNTLQSRSGNQLPFTSINYGTCTLPEGRMVIKALLEGSIKGVGKFHKTPIFPCGIFQCMKGVNRAPGDPNYDLFKLALESTARRIYPNYANVDWSGNAGYDVNDPKTYFSTMGCRTANGADINAEPGVNPQTKDGRGNICPVTIIMPTIAMESKDIFGIHNYATGETELDRINIFMNLLDQKIHEAKDMLIERFNWICSQDASSAKFMYENHTMLGYHPEEGIRSALKHGTIVIGQIGMSETLYLLFGCDHTTEKGMEYAKKIEQLFLDRTSEFKKEYKLNFGVYYTPAENLCYTSFNKFRKAFPEYDIEGVTYFIKNGEKKYKKYFTNSIHVPVYYECDPFQKIDIESQLTGYSNAGCITYVELPSISFNNIDGVEKIVDYAMEHDIPYFALNFPLNRCAKCGEPIYDSELEKCPKCGGDKIIRLGRITG